MFAGGKEEVDSVYLSVSETENTLYDLEVYFGSGDN